MVLYLVFSQIIKNNWDWNLRPSDRIYFHANVNPRCYRFSEIPFLGPILKETHPSIYRLSFITQMLGIEPTAQKKELLLSYEASLIINIFHTFINAFNNSH